MERITALLSHIVHIIHIHLLKKFNEAHKSPDAIEQVSTPTQRENPRPGEVITSAKLNSPTVDDGLLYILVCARTSILRFRTSYYV